RVSSVLNRAIKSYGKNFMFDGNDETCWNSDQGSPQYIMMAFDARVKISSVGIQFQGGFAGKECRLEGGLDSKNLHHLQDFYPKDINSYQIFDGSASEEIEYLKIIFTSSSDFFGRITIYKLDVLGNVCE
ncbi:uncharacterized protein TRIADDRAFT_22604, partial [Trichoplax adhaerens]